MRVGGGGIKKSANVINGVPIGDVYYVMVKSHPRFGRREENGLVVGHLLHFESRRIGDRPPGRRDLRIRPGSRRRVRVWVLRGEGRVCEVDSRGHRRA